MTTQHLEPPDDRHARRPWPFLLLTFVLALGSFACVPDEDTFKKDNPPPASFGTGGGGPDLVVKITGVAHDPQFGTWVLYTVTNNGDEAATSFAVDLYADRGSAPVIGTDLADDFDTVDSLAAGDSAKGGKKIAGYSDNSGTAYAAVDTEQEVTESDESNNVTGAFDWGDVSGASDEVDFEFTIDNQPITISSSNTQGDNTYNWSLDDINGGADGTAKSAISGPISDGFESCLDYDPGLTTNRIGFFRKISSEGGGNDILQFYLDDTGIFFWSGEVDWDYFSFTFPSGTRTFTWCYDKNGSVSAGSDAAWVDEIEVQ